MGLDGGRTDEGTRLGNRDRGHRGPGEGSSGRRLLKWIEAHSSLDSLRGGGKGKTVFRERHPRGGKKKPSAGEGEDGRVLSGEDQAFALAEKIRKERSPYGDAK